MAAAMAPMDKTPREASLLEPELPPLPPEDEEEPLVERAVPFSKPVFPIT